MGMVAVSTYLRALREGRGLTQEEAAVKADIASKTLGRWESGDHEPTLSNLKRLIHVLQGSLEDAIYLMANDSTTPADGRAAAIAWLALSEEERARIDSILTQTPADELDQLLKDLRIEAQKDERRASFLRGLLAGWRDDTPKP